MAKSTVPIFKMKCWLIAETPAVHNFEWLKGSFHDSFVLHAGSLTLELPHQYGLACWSVWACLDGGWTWLLLHPLIWTSLDPKTYLIPMDTSGNTGCWLAQSPSLALLLFRCHRTAPSHCPASLTITQAARPCLCGASHSCCFLTEPSCKTVSKHSCTLSTRRCMWVLSLQMVLQIFLELLVTCSEPNNPPSSFNSLKIHFIYFFPPIWPSTLLLCVRLQIF